MLSFLMRKRSKDVAENSTAEPNTYSTVMIMRLLALAEKYILPKANKTDVREGVEGCPLDSVDEFIQVVLPELGKKENDPSHIETVINKFHSKYKESEILKIWLQVIKKCFTHFDQAYLEDTRVLPNWEDLLRAIQAQIKTEIEISDGKWNESTRRYRDNPVEFFNAMDYQAIQAPFFRFLIALRRSRHSVQAEALHQYLHLLRKIALKQEVNDKASNDENLFGIAFNAVPSLLHALNFTGNIYTKDFIKSLKLESGKKPLIEDANKIELFFFKEILFAILKADVLDAEFEHADYSAFAQSSQTTTTESSIDHRRPFHAKIEQLKSIRQLQMDLIHGTPDTLSKIQDSNLDEKQRQLLVKFYEETTNKREKGSMESIVIQMEQTKLNEPSVTEPEKKDKNVMS